MHYTYDLSNCTDPHLLLQTVPTAILTPEQALAHGYSASPSGWVRLDSTTAAIVASCPFVLLPTLTRANLPEWIYRLTSLFDAGIHFSSIATPDGPAPMPILPANLLRHLNLTFSCPHLSNPAFDARLRSIRMQSIPLLAPSSVPTTPTP